MHASTILTTFAVILLAELPDKSLFASLVLGTRLRPFGVWLGVAAAFTIHVTVAVAVGGALSLLPDRLVATVTAVLFAVGAYVLLFRTGEGEDERGGDDGTGGAKTGGSRDGGAGGAGAGDGSAGLAGAGGADAGARAKVWAGADAKAGAEVDAGARAKVGAKAGARVEAASQRPPSLWRSILASFGIVFLGEMGDITQITTANLAASSGEPLSVGVGALLGLWTAAALAVTVGRGLLRAIRPPVLRRVAGGILTVLAVLSALEAIRG